MMKSSQGMCAFVEAVQMQSEKKLVEVGLYNAHVPAGTNRHLLN
jgi:hypothetical protein